MPDAVKAVGQAVKQEPADELMRRQGHMPRCVAAAIIAPAEGDAGIVGTDQAAVSDGDAVRVAAEIGEDMFGGTEGRLGVDDPALFAQRPKRFNEGLGTAESFQGTEEAQAPGRMGGLQPFEKQAAEQPREHMDRQEEPSPASDPACAISSQHAAGNEAVDMRVMDQRLPPSYGGWR